MIFFHTMLQRMISGPVENVDLRPKICKFVVMKHRNNKTKSQNSPKNVTDTHPALYLSRDKVDDVS